MKAIIPFKHQRHARSKAKARGGAPRPANSASTLNAKRNTPFADGGRQTLELDRTAAPPYAATVATRPRCAASPAPTAFWRPRALPALGPERLSAALRTT